MATPASASLSDYKTNTDNKPAQLLKSYCRIVQKDEHRQCSSSYARTSVWDTVSSPCQRSAFTFQCECFWQKTNGCH